MAKAEKLMWWREDVDPHEDLWLVPAAEAGKFDTSEHAVAGIRIAYDRTRFYSGRGGAGTSKPDGYVAFLISGGRERAVTAGSDYRAELGHFSNKTYPGYTSLRAAKTAVANAMKATPAAAQVAADVNAILEKM